MHYDVDINPEAEDTSHVIVMQLVGEGKTVLDVGCSTGYLAEALRGQDCTVSGIEIDPEAAEKARSHMKDVVVADLDSQRLTSLGIAERFDVIVFADVLEHLKDPLSALRDAKELLNPGGCVVISIPNVAHGAVRLALLDGRFDYSATGLLDETHIRFFTRSTLNEFVARAGFAVQVMRRTVAPVFQTEIRLDPGSVPASVLPRLEADEDADTYQFVFSAVPIVDGSDRLAAIYRDREQELTALRQGLAEIVRRADIGPTAPTIGILAVGDTSADLVRAEVLEGELRRRLDGFRLRRVGSDAAEALTNAEDLNLAMGSMDAVVFTGAIGDRAALAARLRDAGIRTVAFAADAIPATGFETVSISVVGAPSADPGHVTVPDPALAAASVFDADLLARRLDFLRLMGEVPPDRSYLLAAFRGLPDRTDAVLRNLRQVADSQGVELVLVGKPDQASPWSLGSELPVDVVAAVAGAELVLTDEPGPLAMALSLGRPAIGVAPASDAKLDDLASWFGDGDLVVTRFSEVAGSLPLARARAADPGARARVDQALAVQLDELAARLIASALRRGPATVSARILELQDEVNVLRATNGGLVVRQRAERLAFGRRASELLAEQVPTGGSREWSEMRRLVQANEELLAELVEVRSQLEGGADSRSEYERLRRAEEDARRELEALLATRTFRTVRPAREVYRRLRAALRR